jgi:predicted lipoprotein with Yx(FWY)xxD motif
MRTSRWAVIALCSLVLAGCSAGGAAPSTAVPSEAVPASVPAAAEPSPAAATTAPAASSGGGGRGDYDYGTGGEASPSPVSGAGAVQVGTASGPLGTWLTGPGGLTLYTFEPDSANTSTCVDDCATAWPPFTVTAADKLEAGNGVPGKLTTFERPDGTLQVAYDGAPLYYFTSDTAPGDTNGQGLGERWFVAEP